ncbi:MAG: hypothetical protein NT165_02285 [Candidatus Falkowbacteria bacterium]|nr:hypothetical protein [Candidatus Falkowbacteria bacterium]
MPTKKLAIIALMNALISVIYIYAVAYLMSNGQKLFGKTNPVLGGTAILLLFVISAAVMGATIFGRPILLYLDGAKKEALRLFYLTILCLITVATIIFLSMLSLGL